MTDLKPSPGESVAARSPAGRCFPRRRRGRTGLDCTRPSTEQRTADALHDPQQPVAALRRSEHGGTWQVDRGLRRGPAVPNVRRAPLTRWARRRGAATAPGKARAPAQKKRARRSFLLTLPIAFFGSGASRTLHTHGIWGCREGGSSGGCRTALCLCLAARGLAATPPPPAAAQPRGDANARAPLPPVPCTWGVAPRRTRAAPRPRPRRPPPRAPPRRRRPWAPPAPRSPRHAARQAHPGPRTPGEHAGTRGWPRVLKGLCSRDPPAKCVRQVAAPRGAGARPGSCCFQPLHAPRTAATQALAPPLPALPRAAAPPPPPPAPRP